MKSYFLFVTAIILSFHFTFGQDLNLKFGNHNELPSIQAKTLSIYGREGHSFVIYNQTGNKNVIAPLSNSNYEINKTTPFYLPIGDKEGAGNTAQLLGYYPQDDHYLVFCKIIYAKEKQAIIYAGKLNYNGQWSNTVYPLDTVLSKSFTGYATDIEFSVDTNYILLSERPSSMFGGEVQTIYLKLFDKELHTVFNTSIDLKYKLSEAFISSFKVDKNQNIVMLSEIETLVDKKSKRILFVYHPDSKKLIEMPLTLANPEMKYMYGNRFINDELGNIYLTGRYYAKSNASDVTGMYLYQLDLENNSVTRKLTFNYTTDFPELIDYKEYRAVNDIYNLDDGSIVILAQKALWVDNMARSEDVLGFSVKPDGKVGYKFNLLKTQTQGGIRSYIDYQAIHSGNKLFILYNDKEKNMGVTERKKLTTFSGAPIASNAFVAEVNLKDGKFSKRTLIDKSPEEKNPLMDLSTFIKIGDKKYLMKCDFESSGKFRFLEITVD